MPRLPWLSCSEIARLRRARPFISQKVRSALSLVGHIFLIAFTFFSGREVFNPDRRIVRTIMIAAVIAVIITNRRAIIAALVAGKTPDRVVGEPAAALHPQQLSDVAGHFS